ncbi:MAG: prolyl oligopeptidase family serine peptidase [Phycisphaeraceae bacterium]|nr:prolyl oligopeptidase family serine peptidase [Phycisphaeraceae bacterium]
MTTYRRLFVFLLCVGIAAGAFAVEADAAAKDAKTDKQKELKLEDLMPEKSLFGPSASQMSFSFDGRYGAYLYKTYKERRHGNDLFLYDVEKGVTQRVTWPSVMAQFQKKARDVVEDRQKQAKKAGSDSEKKDEDKDVESDSKKELVAQARPEDGTKDRKAEKRKQNKARRRKERDAKQAKKQKTERKADQKKETKQQQGEDEEVLKKRGDWVSDKDADDKKAPRYGGISSVSWSPVAGELLFTSDGDVYRYTLADDKVVRVTQTRGREYSIAWVLDGSGFTFRRDSGLFKMRMSDKTLRQLDPRFPNGDSMRAYRLSPDGRHIAFMTDKEIEGPESSKVEIANYRDRMMKAREVSRRVSDDKLPVHEKRIYLYTLSELDDEKDTLTEVYLGKTNMPDDRVKTPVWSPDSKKIAFLSFHQDEGVVRLFEAYLPEDKKEAPESDPNDEDQGKDEDKDEDKTEDKAKAEDKQDEASKAKEIYRFLHHGGPNTPGMMVFHYLADNRRLVYLSEQSGFRHLHVLDPVYENSKPLTSGPYEVYPLGISRDRQWFFFEATREHPSQLDVYRLNTKDGQVTRLTREVGQHTGSAVSQDGTRILTNLASYDQLKELVFIDVQKDSHKVLTDSHPEKAHEFAEPSPEFFDFENRHGHRLYGMMFKPDDWKETDKRPVLIYFYGGPLGTRKMVVQGSFSPYNFAFPYYLAKKHGYVACTIDTRGNSGYAGVFEKANFGQVGKPQVEDLVDAVTYLKDNQGVDPNRIGIHGWSFGGFQTQMCMYTEPDVFQVGIAGAGPTEWENYNSWYTRHAIGKSEPGKATLKKFSLLPLAKNLKGQLLLVHGMEDSNVLYQDTVRVYRELLKAGKETLVELFLDPTGGHGLGGDVKTLSRYRKYEDFLLRTLGTASADSEKEAPAKKAK